MVFTLSAQYQHNYGTEEAESGRSVKFTKNDEGYILAGLTKYPFIANGDAMLIKVNANGWQIFSKMYGGENQENFNSVRDYENSTSEIRYYALGFTNSFGAEKGDAYLIATDINGNLIFSKTYGGKNYETGNCLQIVRDKEYGTGLVFVGETYSYNETQTSDIYVVRTDLKGNLIRATAIGTEKYKDSGCWIEQTSDYGYIIAGYTYAPCSKDVITSLNANFYIVKLNINLEIEWSRIIDTKYDDYILNDFAYCIKENSDKTYIVTGRTDNPYRSSGKITNTDVALLNLDNNGNVIWMKTYDKGVNDQGRCILQEFDKEGNLNYVISGTTNDSETSNPVVLLHRTDVNGNPLYTITHGIHGKSYGYEIDRGNDEGYAIAGDLYKNSNMGDELFFVETDASGLTSDGCNLKAEMKPYKFKTCAIKGAKQIFVDENMNVDSKELRVILGTQDCPLLVEDASTKSGLLNKFEGFSYDNTGCKIIDYHTLVEDQLMVKFQSEFTGNLEVFSIDGRVEYHENLTSEVDKTIHINNLKAGVYLLKITGANDTIDIIKFVKF